MALPRMQLHLSGIKDWYNLMGAFPLVIREKINDPAVRAVAVAAKKIAKPMYPLGTGKTPSGESRTHLRNALVVKQIPKRRLRSRGNSFAVMGFDRSKFKKTQTWHAHLFEWGTGSRNRRPSRLGPSRSKKAPYKQMVPSKTKGYGVVGPGWNRSGLPVTTIKTKDGRFLGKSFIHQGAKSHRFMLKAGRMIRPRVRKIFIRKISTTLPRELLKFSAKQGKIKPSQITGVGSFVIDGVPVTVVPRPPTVKIP